jgi:hypothetical protein
VTLDPSDHFSVPKSAVRQMGVVVTTLIALAVLALLLLSVARLLRPPDSLAAAIAPNEYQAVFLTNGQVYFGTLSAPGGDFYYLRHVYYLTSQASLQSGRRVQVLLKPLGSSLHDPADLMVINRAQISFVENLKPSGAVARYLARTTGG